jgi:transcriptional regulator with XRE-family HTH domain
MEEPSMNIGERLRTLRTSKHLSQGDIERRSGLLRSYISSAEHGHTVPSLKTLERWAKALEAEVYQLFFEGEGNPKPVPVGAREAMDKREEKLLGFFRRADEAERRLMLDIAREMAKSAA